MHLRCAGKALRGRLHSRPAAWPTPRASTAHRALAGQASHAPRPSTFASVPHAVCGHNNGSSGCFLRQRSRTHTCFFNSASILPCPSPIKSMGRSCSPDKCRVVKSPPAIKRSNSRGRRSTMICAQGGVHNCSTPHSALQQRQLDVHPVKACL